MENYDFREILYFECEFRLKIFSLMISHDILCGNGAFYSPKHIREEFFLLDDKHCHSEQQEIDDDCKKLIAVTNISYRDVSENILVKRLRMIQLVTFCLRFEL